MYSRSSQENRSQAVNTALESLALHTNNITLYSAGLPYSSSNFSRDSLLSAILMGDAKMLRDQLMFCAILQGVEKNQYTGEEPGKIYFENPPGVIHGRSTEYSACDTTALFIIGHEVYLNLTEDDSFLNNQKQYIEKAVEYILSHLVNNLFVENPEYCGGNRFAYPVTYWKHAGILNRKQGVPAYPAVFTLAHVQNMKALKSAGILLEAPDLLHTAAVMKRFLYIFFDDKHQVFSSGLDQKGYYPGTTSDTLHLLYYLDENEISKDKLDKIVSQTKILETPYGYLTANLAEAWLSKQILVTPSIHHNTVWPFEQAFIHMAARKFALSHVTEVSERIYKHLHDFSELFFLHKDEYWNEGKEIRLTSIAVKEYFDSYFKNIQQGLLTQTL